MKRPDHANTSLHTPRSSMNAEKLVTVETQAEFDFITGEREERIFLKMYVAARTSGLLAAISDRDWKTLCVLATYMDAHGYCFPSQTELAKALGCSRQMANERVNALARFRFHDQPVFLIVKGQRSEAGKWAHNGYRVLPIASLDIFNKIRHDGERAVSRNLDTDTNSMLAVSSATVTVQLDTNKNQTFLNKNNNLSNVRMDKNTEFNVDNFQANVDKPHRNGSPSGDGNTENEPKTTTSTFVKNSDIASGKRSQQASTGIEAVGTVLKRGRGRPPKVAYDEDRAQIMAYIQDFAREMGDTAPLKSSVTRAYNLYKASGKPIGTFIDALYQARAKTKERSAAIRSTGDRTQPYAPKAKMAYYFAVLEDQLGLRDDKQQDSREELRVLDQ